MSKQKVEIKINYAGVGALLKGAECQTMLTGLAGQVSGKAGDGYASDTKRMGSRYIASAYTDTAKAMKDNLENNTLLRSL